MGSALDYLPALALGQKASTITGASNDVFIGMGYASLVQSITGAPPTIADLGNRKAQIVLTAAQSATMKNWLSKNVAAAVKIAKSPTNLDLNTGTYVMPVVLSYAIPAILAAFAVGWIANSLLGKR
jgi:hypothetical protein